MIQKTDYTAEVEGQTDAISEEKAAADADAWGPDSTAAAAAGNADAAPAEEQEPEEVQKSLSEYLAEKAQAGLEGILGKKEGRTVTAEALEGAKFAREGIDEFFHGKVSVQLGLVVVKAENCNQPTITNGCSEEGAYSGNERNIQGDIVVPWR